MDFPLLYQMGSSLLHSSWAKSFISIQPSLCLSKGFYQGIPIGDEVEVDGAEARIVVVVDEVIVEDFVVDVGVPMETEVEEVAADLETTREVAVGSEMIEEVAVDLDTIEEVTADLEMTEEVVQNLEEIAMAAIEVASSAHLTVGVVGNRAKG